MPTKTKHTESSKKPDDSYEGIMVTTRNVRGVTNKMTIRSNCPGNLKIKPFWIYLLPEGFKQILDNSGELNHDRVIDPIDNTLQGKLPLSSSDKQLNAQSYVGVSVIGPSAAWIRY